VMVSERGLYRFPDWGRLPESGFRLDAVFNVALMMAAQKLAKRPPYYLELLTLAKYRNCGLGDASPWSPAITRLIDPALDLNSAEAADALRDALEAHAQALRKGRKMVNFMDIVSLQTVLAPIWQKPLALYLMLRFAMQLDVIVSSPHASDSIAIIGRIGIALPIRLFSVHYEIHEHEISLAFMAGAKRPFTYAEIAATFKECLDRVVSIANQSRELESEAYEMMPG
jgi:hypothetical protein